MFTFSPLTKIRSSQVNQNFTDLSTGAGDVDANRLQLLKSEALIDHVVSGLLWSQVSGLNGTMTAGIVNITSPAGLMLRLSISSIATRAFTASKDTYVDVDYNGTITYLEVANGGVATALAANSLRLAKVVTNGSAITSVTTKGTDNRTTPNVIHNTAPLATSDLENPVKFSAYLGADQASGTGGFFQVNINTLNYDTGGNFSTVNKYFVAPFDGYYHFDATILFQGQAGLPKLLSLTKNSISAEFVRLAEIPNTTGNITISGGIDLLLNQNDYVAMLGYSTENKTVLSSMQYTRFSGHLISRV